MAPKNIYSAQSKSLAQIFCAAFFCIIFVTSINEACGSPSLAKVRKNPFALGEKATYQVTYFGATAGILEVEILPSKVGGAGAHSTYEALVRTDSIFSLFYRLKNIYRTTVDSVTGEPVEFLATLNESRQQGTTTQRFDQSKHKVHFLDDREHSKKGKIHKEFVKDIQPRTQDVVSALFHLRAQPLEKGLSFEMPIFVGEESYRARVDVVDEEELATKIGRVPAFVVKPSLVMADGKLKELPETLAWIGKEKDRPLLKVKAKVKVGSIIAYLTKFTPGVAKAESVVSEANTRQ